MGRCGESRRGHSHFGEVIAVELAVPKVDPFYSRVSFPINFIYHAHSDCGYGERIEWRITTDGRPAGQLCSRCSTLIQNEKLQALQQMEDKIGQLVVRCAETLAALDGPKTDDHAKKVAQRFLQSAEEAVRDAVKRKRLYVHRAFRSQVVKLD